MFRKFIDINVSISKWFDKHFIPTEMRKDGNKDFIENFAPKWIKKNIILYDIGGGKNPFISISQKRALNIRVIGIDISEKELNLAPSGSYDSIISKDISLITGTGDGDIVICQAVLEHVADNEGAFKSISSLLKKGGIALIFVPSKNAVYSKLNILLPQKIKKKILYSIYPSTARNQGFISYYKLCTPNDFISISKKNNLKVIDQDYYYISSYFSFFFPLYIVWRIWTLIYKRIAGKQAAETFSIALKKQ